VLNRMFDSDDQRWTALCARDRTADGTFVFAVLTTGVYCRPSCGARRPLRQNVRFYEDGAAARRAGYRACLRCRPDQQGSDALAVAKACSAMDAAEDTPHLADLAQATSLPPAQLHRVFRAATGLTPRQWHAARRAGRVAEMLGSGANVTQAIHNAGYGAASRFYAAEPLGMTPSAFQDGGAGETLRFATAPCALGQVLAAATKRGLCAVWLGDDAADLEAELRRRFPQANLLPGDMEFATLLAQVVTLVEHPESPQDLPLDLHGTAFQLRVWQALRAIPSGQTISYAALAARLGMPNGARAVARACATNDVAIAVPCHRVVRGCGDLAGYRWGLSRKKSLLAREKA
jgi:AraC family transcriptional regulator, regulatory protein of adaptative response / methylated-DNA-[protein]-cysteine methyltransferase